MNNGRQETSISLQSPAPHPCLLITGGCGFIGTNLLDYMLKKGFTRFRILDNLSVGRIEDLESVLGEQGTFEKREETDKITYNLSSLQSPSARAEVELYIGDIRNPEDCNQSTENTSAVIHLAAQSGVPVSVKDPLFDCEMNVTGTLNILEACRKNGVKRFVFASSGAPLGEIEPPVHEQKVPRPVSPYGASKLAGEAYCSAYCKTFGINTVTLRFGNVYGPRSRHKTSVVAKFFKRAIEGLPLEIYGDGTQTRDFIFIEDLCNAIYLSLKALGLTIQPPASISHTVAGEVFQIATFRETTVSEIAGRIKEIVERENGKTVDIIYSEKRAGDVQRNYSDISKAMNLLGFKPEYDLERGLYETWKAFRSPGDSVKVT
ncbi:MAG: NAD-dependent epimerase/dehydratase family protein [Deferribacteres bacterium]|nr:NAD-dependent epimerase/dehydratase family protein [Deferribacteres bacterium]